MNHKLKHPLKFRCPECGKYTRHNSYIHHLLTNHVGDGHSYQEPGLEGGPQYAQASVNIPAPTATPILYVSMGVTR